jgi:ElaB/YqjD/DUF883 family membrane-anchored ribosome-binding protein
MTPTPEHTIPHDSTIDEIKALLAEAENVISASGDGASEEIASLKERLGSALDRSRDTAQKVMKLAKDRAARADEAIQTHPYVAIGIAAGVGLLVGALLTRSRSPRG